MNTVTLPAHFDGQQIVLDEPYNLESDASVFVTIVPQKLYRKSIGIESLSGD